MLLRHLSLFALAATGMTHTFAADRPLAIDPAQSRVEIAVKATVDSFTGKLTHYEPTIMIGEDGRVSSARVAFRFRDVVTGKESRDKAMHKWQQTDAFPEGTFVLSSLDTATGGSYTASGRLTFHGITRDIRFPVTVTRDGTVFGIDGDATIDTREYGLPVIRMIGVLKVDPIVHVRFHLQGNAGGLTPSTHAAR